MGIESASFPLPEEHSAACASLEAADLQSGNPGLAGGTERKESSLRADQSQPTIGTMQAVTNSTGLSVRNQPQMNPFLSSLQLSSPRPLEQSLSSNAHKALVRPGEATRPSHLSEHGKRGTLGHGFALLKKGSTRCEVVDASTEGFFPGLRPGLLAIQLSSSNGAESREEKSPCPPTASTDVAVPEDHVCLQWIENNGYYDMTIMVRMLHHLCPVLGILHNPRLHSSPLSVQKFIYVIYLFISVG